MNPHDLTPAAGELIRRWLGVPPWSPADRERVALYMRRTLHLRATIGECRRMVGLAIAEAPALERGPAAAREEGAARAVLEGGTGGLDPGQVTGPRGPAMVNGRRIVTWHGEGRSLFYVMEPDGGYGGDWPNEPDGWHVRETFTDRERAEIFAAALPPLELAGAPRCDDPGAHGPGCACDGGEPVL